MEKDIGKLRKNENTEIVIRLDDFGGKKGLTIREFVTSDRYTGFTKSGVRIPSSDFKKFKDFVNSIDESDLEESESSEGEMPKDQKKLDKSDQSEEDSGNEESGDQDENSDDSDKDELPDY